MAPAAASPERRAARRRSRRRADGGPARTGRGSACCRSPRKLLPLACNEGDDKEYRGDDALDVANLSPVERDGLHKIGEGGSSRKQPPPELPSSWVIS